MGETIDDLDKEIEHESNEITFLLTNLNFQVKKNSKEKENSKLTEILDKDN